jgi:predicted outer membrane repeat protein
MISNTKTLTLLLALAAMGCDNTVPEDKPRDTVDSTTETDDTGVEADRPGSGGSSDTDEPADTGEPQRPSSADSDGDGFTVAEGDCDDLDDQIHPDADEVCDGLDNNCDGSVDPDESLDAATWYRDLDGDGFGATASGHRSCVAGATDVTIDTDCDDASAFVHPGADEICDGQDNNCDGVADDDVDFMSTWYADRDEDGYGDPTSPLRGCSMPSPGFPVATSYTDCDDTDFNIHPGAEEVCDGVDNDCDGWESDGIATWFHGRGESVDVTAELTGTPGDLGFLSLESSGTLRICPGTWYAEISVNSSDVTIEGVGGAATTIIDTDPTGSMSIVTNNRPISIYTRGGEVEVRGLTLTGGSASGDGGGLYASGADVTLDSVTVTDNYASEDGGGIYSIFGSLTLIDSTITENYSGDDGGGVYVDGELIVSGGEISGNEAADDGGGIKVYDSLFATATISGTTIESNDAGDDGGGVAVYSPIDSEVTLVDSIIRRNQASDNGGGVYVTTNPSSHSGEAWVTCSVTPGATGGFYGNDAGDGGGGAYLAAPGLRVVDSTGCDWGTGMWDNTVYDIQTSDWWARSSDTGDFMCSDFICWGTDDEGLVSWF